MGQRREDSAPWLGIALLCPQMYPGQEVWSLGSLAQRWVGSNRVNDEPRARRKRGAGNREPREALLTQATPRRGENSIASCSSRPPAPLSAAPRRGEITGRSSSVLWAAAVGAGGQRRESVQRLWKPSWGTVPAAGATARGAAQSAPRCAPCSGAARSQCPGCSPRRCSLPSDSAAQKANGKGASFKVHINLVLVGYSLAATTAVPKRMVLTAQGGLLLGTCSAFTSWG